MNLVGRRFRGFDLLEIVLVLVRVWWLCWVAACGGEEVGCGCAVGLGAAADWGDLVVAAAFDRLWISSVIGTQRRDLWGGREGEGDG